jgi:ADP-ribose pyrophosphatase
MIKLICCFFLATALIAEEPLSRPLQEYLELMHRYPQSIGLSGDATKGEIELLDDAALIALAGQKTKRDVGILYQDRFWIWVNDPVKYSNGNIGVYGRIINRSSLNGFAGCAVIPCLKNGRIALNCNFRHSTRSWELEIPRGFIDPGETAEEAAQREVWEETGLIANNLALLGEMAPDTGQSNTIVTVYRAEIDEWSQATPQESEGIESIVFLNIAELKDALRNGSIVLNVKGEKRKVFVRDPFMTYGLFQMDLRGWFSFTETLP